MWSERGVGRSALEITCGDEGKSQSWYIVSFPNMQECDKWMQHLRLAINLLESQAKNKRASLKAIGSRSRLSSSQSTPRGSPRGSPRRSSSGSSSGEFGSPFSSGGSASGGSASGSASGSARRRSDGESTRPSPLVSEQKVSAAPTVVHCPHCNEVLTVPANAHVMKCHFCRKVFLFRSGRSVGKPVYRDGYLGVVTKSGMFGRKTIKSRYCVLTNTEISMFKTMDVFLHQGESSVKMLVPISSDHSNVSRAPQNGKTDRRNTFLVETLGSHSKIHELNADSEEDAMLWIRAVETAMQPRGHSGSVSSPYQQQHQQQQQQQQHHHQSPLAPSHIQAYAAPLPRVPPEVPPLNQPARGGGGRGGSNGRSASSASSGSNVTAAVVIPAGIDPDTFLSLPKDIQDQLLRGELI